MQTAYLQQPLNIQSQKIKILEQYQYGQIDDNTCQETSSLPLLFNKVINTQCCNVCDNGACEQQQ